MTNSPKVHALIPAYNSASTIGAVIQGIHAHGIDVTVIDDGSSDSTKTVAQSHGARVLRYPINRGKGHALIMGFRWALDHEIDLILTLDSDGQHSPDDLPKFLAEIPRADLVVGHRDISLEQMPVDSFMGNTISTFFISQFCGQPFPDTQCGYRMYSRHFLNQVPLRGGRFETETELLMRAALLGLRIRWVPIQTLYTIQNGRKIHQGHFRNFTDTLRIISVALQSTSFPRKGG